MRRSKHFTRYKQCTFRVKFAQALRICQSVEAAKFANPSPKIQIRLASKCSNNPFS